MRRRVLGVLGWMVAVAVATGVGLTAVSLLSRGLTGESVEPLSEDSVARTLASSGPPPSPTHTAAPRSTAPSPLGSAGSPVHARTRALDSAGGTVIARCRGKTSYLESWSPAPGWQVDDDDRGPGPVTSVEFDGASTDNDDLGVTVTVTCRAGEPVSHVAVEDD